MKGIILAGGLGSRLHPITLATCKQLLPVYDKPMIFYPLSVLLLSKIRDILLITTSQDIACFQTLLGDGSHLGISLSYAIQENPRGIAEAFIIGESFINQSPVALILGDNIFYGNSLSSTLLHCSFHTKGGLIFGYEVKDPARYGVMKFDASGQIVDIIEKPKKPPSSFVVTGLYYYDANVVEIAKSLKPSQRGELEITEINQVYLLQKELQWILLERGFVWLDTGTPAALLQASNYVQTVQERQGITVGCIEEIAYRMGYIDLNQLEHLAFFYKTEYGDYLREVVYREENPMLSSCFL